MSYRRAGATLQHSPHVLHCFNLAGCNDEQVEHVGVAVHVFSKIPTAFFDKRSCAAHWRRPNLKRHHSTVLEPCSCPVACPQASRAACLQVLFQWCQTRKGENPWTPHVHWVYWGWQTVSPLPSAPGLSSRLPHPHKVKKCPSSWCHKESGLGETSMHTQAVHSELWHPISFFGPLPVKVKCSFKALSPLRYNGRGRHRVGVKQHAGQRWSVLAYWPRKQRKLNLAKRGSIEPSNLHACGVRIWRPEAVAIFPYKKKSRGIFFLMRTSWVNSWVLPNLKHSREDFHEEFLILMSYSWVLMSTTHEESAFTRKLAHFFHEEFSFSRWTSWGFMRILTRTSWGFCMRNQFSRGLYELFHEVLKKASWGPH